MGAVTFIAKNTFKKIFKNLAEELESPVSGVQIGICYNEGVHKFEAYIDFKKIKDINPEDYIGTVVDLTGGITVIEATIAQSIPRYAKELECSPDEVNVIMRYVDGKLPDAVLLRGTEKIRKIDIEQEFLSN